MFVRWQSRKRQRPDIGYYEGDVRDEFGPVYNRRGSCLRTRKRADGSIGQDVRWTAVIVESVRVDGNPTPLGIPVPGAGNFQDLPPEVFGGLGKTTAISDSRSDAEFVEDDAAEGFRVKEAGGGICAECQLTPPDGGSATGGAHGCHCC